MTTAGADPALTVCDRGPAPILGSGSGTHHAEYVDNFAAISTSKDDAEKLVSEAREVLDSLGLQ